MNEHELILMSVCDCRRSDLYVDPQPLTPKQQQLVQTACQRRQAGEPLQYILGRTDFMGLSLAVDERVFIPRPETELLVEAALDRLRLKDRIFVNILDLGSGSGNIAVSLAYFFPEAEVTAVDLDRSALNVAAFNARQHGLDERIFFVHSAAQEFLETSFRQGRKFDMIISNPPYIAQDQIGALPLEVQKEPVVALDGGKDGLEIIRCIISQAGSVITAGGWLGMEIGDGQAASVERLLRQQRIFQRISFIKDYCQTERIVLAQTKGSNQE